MVVKVHSEEEVARIIPIAAKHQVPITFRAAGTSLSGQAITDSVLLKLSHTGRNFRSFHIPVSFRGLLTSVNDCHAADLAHLQSYRSHVVILDIHPFHIC